ncbi:MAG: DDE-type integrase/transposase/recombinase [Patescibacteria group bacterium]
MKDKINSIALFRMSVLGQLISRNKLERGELNKILNDLATKSYNIPNSKHNYISKKTIEKWYYAWLKDGVKGLNPKERSDIGTTKISSEVQQAAIELKKANLARSINTVISLLGRQGIICEKEISRSSLYRFLKSKELNKRIISDSHLIERRSFVAEHAGDIWQADVMHGPRVQTSKGLNKVYLVSLMDDATRFIMHNAFCLGETALDIEGVLKQAVLKRGLPKKIILDNGSAYRSKSLQQICILLGIKLIYCRPYEPQGKGKLERFHRTFREQFLSELDIKSIYGLDDLNNRLWAWIDRIYHRNSHSGLNNRTPLECWREDLINVRQLGNLAMQIDEIFYHRYKRKIRSDGTLQWNGELFEAPFHLVGKEVNLIVDPHVKKALWVESKSGKKLGVVTPLDKIGNNQRKRCRPELSKSNTIKNSINIVDLACQEHEELYSLNYKESK